MSTFHASKSNPKPRIRAAVSSGGFGARELLILIAAIALLVLIAIPQIARSRAKSWKVCCNCNLKQIGLAARMWAGDHGGLFPWAAPMSTNGVMKIATSGDLAAMFRAMANEIGTPYVLLCPADKSRSRETDWTKLKNSNISYFIGLDAQETMPQTILSGDRNISGGTFLSNRVMEVRSTNSLVWGADMHSHQGNIGLGDGSAQQVTDRTLQNQAQAQAMSGLSVARFAFP